MQNQEREALKKEWQKEWNEKGEKYAKAVNDMVAFAEAHGWDAYKGEEPLDERAHLGEAVFALLKKPTSAARLRNLEPIFRHQTLSLRSARTKRTTLTRRIK